MKWVVWSLRAVSLAALTGAVTALGADQPASTTTYRWVDAQGVVHYSDTPQPGAEQLKIHPAQTYSPAPVSGASNRPAAEQNAGGAYQACSVAQPSAEQSFFAPEDVTVSVNLRPVRQAGDQVSVTMDGAPLQPADDSGLRYRISEPDRGAHTLSVTVHNSAGTVVCSSSGVTFYVQRPSLNSPQSPARGH